MKQWSRRASEIAYLLNPAFCARVLLNSIESYTKESSKPFPYPLLYLILPIALHKKSRDLVDTRTKMHVWISKHQDLQIDFAVRAKSLISFTNEALLYLLNSNLVCFDNEGNLVIPSSRAKLSQTRFADGDVKKCLVCARSIGRWFARSGEVSTIYISWGIKP